MDFAVGAEVEDCEDNNSNVESDETAGDRGAGVEEGYFCPRFECQERKPDKTFKIYSRHFRTRTVCPYVNFRKLLTQKLDVQCEVPCVGCHITITRVSAIKRHFAKCTELKKMRTAAKHTETLALMKSQMDSESKRASRHARDAINGHKRRRHTMSNKSGPRKKLKSQNCSKDSFIAIVPPRAEDESPNGCGRMDTIEQPPYVHPDTIPISKFLDSGPSVLQNDATTAMETSNLMIETVGEAAIYFANRKQPNVAGTGAASVSQISLVPTTNETTAYSHDPLPTMHDSATDANASSIYFTNNHRPTANTGAHAIRGSSFMSYTMDGSFLCPEGQYPIAQNGIASKRGSSFMNNTMDGSYFYTDDSHPTIQNLDSWPPANCSLP